MRLIFLYTADGQAATGTMPPWDIGRLAENHYAAQFKEEGYFCILRELVRRGIVQECMIVIESMHGSGTILFEPGLYLHVMPEINYLDAMLKPSDVIWCRHGFRSWFPFLSRCSERGQWLMLYGANGGRERWRFWDIILNDLEGRNYIDEWGRINLDFRKPVNTDIFNYQPEKADYDIMIGASHIHDKKAQWKVVNALIEYKRIYKECPACVLPGRPYHGEKTNRMYEDINKHALRVTKTGMVERNELAGVMRRTKVFLHMGTGQGDRGAIEAGHCGCYPVIGQPRYHHPAMTQEFAFSWSETDGSDPEVLAYGLHTILESMNGGNELQRKNIAGYYAHQFSLEARTLPLFSSLFYGLSRHRPGDSKEALLAEIL